MQWLVLPVICAVASTARSSGHASPSLVLYTCNTVLIQVDTLGGVYNGPDSLACVDDHHVT